MNDFWVTPVFLLFAAATAVQLAAWWALYARLAFYRAPRTAYLERPPVSVLVCARNEAPRLRANLPALLRQAYPCFEVLVIDDDSTDDTPETLQRLQQQFPQLRVLKTGPKTRPGKKAALEQGIRAARFESLVFTDADCRPAGPNWLAGMAAGLGENAEITLGYGPLRPAPGLLNRWARFETVQTAMQYFSCALAGWPYMGVGRNLAWQRPLFDRVGGFSGHAKLVSGDDDLLVNAAARRGNTRCCLAPETFVFSDAPASWAAWLRQKRRHLSAGKKYRRRHQLLLGLLAFSQILHYFLLPILLTTAFGTISVVFYAVRMASAFLIYLKILGQLSERGLLFWWILFDAGLAVYYAAIAPLALIPSDDLISWK